MTAKYLPQVLPDFAEDEEYPAGVEPWAGAPNKVEPAQAERDTGVSPGDQMAAQHYNWLNHRYGRGVRVLSHSAMQTWQCFPVSIEEDVVIDGDTFSLRRPSLSGVTLGSCAALINQLDGAPAHRSIIASAPDSSTKIFGSSYGAVWNQLTDIADTNIVDFAGGIPGVVFAIRLGERHIDHSTDFGETWTESTNVSPASGSFSTLLVSDARVLAAITGTADGTGNRVYVSDNNGTTWTAKDIGNGAYSIISWATNGAGTIVAYAQNAGFGGVDKILYSTNNGNTWAVGHSADVGLQNGTVAYSPVWDQFMVITDDGHIYNSGDGVSWSTREGFAFLPASAKSLACVGGVFACAVKTSFVTGDPLPSGVIYTFDFGGNWHLVNLSDMIDSDFRIRTLIEHSGRFLAGSAGKVFLSGPLWIPDADLVITA